MYKVIEELIVKVEEIGSKFAFLVPSFLHFLVLNPWIWVKDNLENIITGIETIVTKFLDTAKERFPSQFAFVSKYTGVAVEKTRLNAKAIERRGEQTVELLNKSFQLWKSRVTEAGVNIEKTVIHPTATKVAAQSKPYILKAIEITEPAITMAKPVWEPIADKVVEVNTAAVNVSYVGPVIAKVESVLGETVGNVLQYCNVELISNSIVLHDVIL